MSFWKKKPKQQLKNKSQNAIEPKKTSSNRSTTVKHPKSEVVKKDPRNPEKEFLRVFKQLTYRHRPLDIWRDFVTMFACSISNAVDKTRYDERESLYLKTIRKYSKEEQMLFPELVAETVMGLELNSEQDFLGKLYMTLELGNDSNCQFFTPYSVCQCMAQIAMGDVSSKINERGFFTINDPCCGAGATLIAGIHEARRQLEKQELNFQNHIFVMGQDIDSTVALMCYIQISLLGMAGYIKIGNSLTEPITSCDSLENCWFTPMYFSEIWTTRRLVEKMRSL